MVRHTEYSCTIQRVVDKLFLFVTSVAIFLHLILRTRESDEYETNHAMNETIVKCASVSEFDHRVRTINSAHCLQMRGVYLTKFDDTHECFVEIWYYD